MWVALCLTCLKGLRGSLRGPVSSLKAHRAGGILWSWLHSLQMGQETQWRMPSLWCIPSTPVLGEGSFMSLLYYLPPEVKVALYFKRCGQCHWISLWVQVSSRASSPPVPLSAALSSASLSALITLVTYLVPVWYSQLLGSSPSQWSSLEITIPWPIYMWENRDLFLERSSAQKTSWYQKKNKKTKKTPNPDLPLLLLCKYA